MSVCTAARLRSTASAAASRCALGDQLRLDAPIWTPRHDPQKTGAIGGVDACLRRWRRTQIPGAPSASFPGPPRRRSAAPTASWPRPTIPTPPATRHCRGFSPSRLPTRCSPPRPPAVDPDPARLLARELPRTGNRGGPIRTGRARPAAPTADGPAHVREGARQPLRREPIATRARAHRLLADEPIAPAHPTSGPIDPEAQGLARAGERRAQMIREPASPRRGPVAPGGRRAAAGRGRRRPPIRPRTTLSTTKSSNRTGPARRGTAPRAAPTGRSTRRSTRIPASTDPNTRPGRADRMMGGSSTTRWVPTAEAR